ncbi:MULTISPECIES: GTP cyclohydrolase I FolE [Dyadobacter]|jgi:GTP cyclohydrolase I|uniref:GTP cyclohydrolase 1 n=1 Tax=Dyadobacter chenhuakuii TaxID=2909339 RepID=A0A9X1Q9G3_9BACT|nr:MULTISPECIES: GTP cyclohydrolase I FolE [Dyadobacter]MCE7072452.1 GTP cyclohydrolase I FolE [Dyadobacter sp. CY327]MCF2494498.1 GTP cyclohydrolase I FolE [Dyadobacter chenhuakuii]MCF2497595.1 GTP cyclohydrolase I FolE [Dyadobacter chenhuakuii]MCF2519773.1 GTP cyclohydrolase I FolE [Dyadobacter sp. CY351]USJ32178.1 GTP cyclohydrolase I FolE [Dyadobacter chenhuakuii]
MKQNGTLSNIPSTEMVEVEEVGNDHVFSSIDTPLRKDAFAMEDDMKMELIEKHFRHIMEIMGLDLTDDSLKGTPKRVAKMFITEVFSGLDPKNKPAVTLFENKYKYDQMLVEKDISVFSNCEHHFVPIYGKAHVAYISSGKVIGLSKLNRIVEYFAKRPQVQERLTVQIATELKLALETEDVAVVIDAQHMCVQSRGIRDSGSSTVTAFYGGKFQEESTKKEFLSYLGM